MLCLARPLQFAFWARYLFYLFDSLAIFSTDIRTNEINSPKFALGKSHELYGHLNTIWVESKECYLLSFEELFCTAGITI